MRFSLVVRTYFAFAVLLAARSTLAASASDFIPYSFIQNNNTVLPGRLHIPAEYATDPTTPRPLILFLHGAGESGTNNLAQINGNIDNLLTAAKARGAFLYAPQTNSGWGTPTLLSWAMTMIDRAIGERSVDPNRIYVTGLSMGGGGVWNFLNRFPDRVAAAVPICGVSPASSEFFVDPSAGFVPANVVNEPIWAFHARNDGTVSPRASRNVIDSLLNEGGQPLPAYPSLSDFTADFKFDDSLLDLHYTEYRTGGHGIWPKVYNTAAMYDWMFSHGVVPEPTTRGLALVGLLAASSRRRRLR